MLLVKASQSTPCQQEVLLKTAIPSTVLNNSRAVSQTELLHFLTHCGGSLPCLLSQAPASISHLCKHSAALLAWIPPPATHTTFFFYYYYFLCSPCLTAILALTDSNWLNFFFNHELSLNEIGGREVFDVQKASRVSDGFKGVHAKKSRMRGPMENLEHTE